MEHILEMMPIIGVIFGGVNLFLMSIAKSFWSLTFGTLKKSFEASEKDRIKEKEINSTFRHKHIYDVKNLNTIIELKFEGLNKTMKRIEDTLIRLDKK